MASKKEKVTADEAQVIEPIEVETEATDKLANFWAKNGKKLTAFGIGLLAGVAIFFGYKYFIKEPKIKAAAEAIFPAENLFGKMSNTGFGKDSVNILLNGGILDGTKITGLLSVISKHSGTPAANRANYEVGATYLQTKEFDKAIKYLKEFDGNGATQTEIKKFTMLGHAYAELKKTDDAFAAYKKATTINAKDETFTPEALFTAAAYAEVIGKSKDAIELYTQARDKYPLYPAVSNGDVDKYLAKLGVTK
jgi:predicted negative regulator of RcsB-dependent stress response